jgi:hypothetical protein
VKTPTVPLIVDFATPRPSQMDKIDINNAFKEYQSSMQTTKKLSPTKMLPNTNSVIFKQILRKYKVALKHKDLVKPQQFSHLLETLKNMQSQS